MNDCHVAHNKCHLSTFRHVTNFFLKKHLIMKSGGFLLPEGKSQLKHAEKVFFILHVFTPNFGSSLIKIIADLVPPLLVATAD